MFAFAALMAASGMLVADGATRTSAAPAKYVALVGNGARGISVNQYMPANLVIGEGDTISWTSVYAEPHTVTFLAGKARPDDIMAVIGGLTPKYDGTAQISSGFVRPGTTFDVTFTKAGTYNFLCLVHEGQTGSVTVLSPGMYVPSQAQIDSDIKASLAAGLAVGEKALPIVPPPAMRITAANGTSTWTVPDAPVIPYKGSTVNLNIFIPARLEIGVGDTVTWLDNTPVPHTITFLAGGTPRSPVAVVAPAGGLYDGSSYVNSGQLGTAPGRSGTKFSLTFTKAGTYPFICILHVDQGMAGVVVVGDSAAGSATLRPPATGDAGLADHGVAAWPLALAVGLLGLGGLAAMRLRWR